MSLQQDLKTILYYGTPNVFVWGVVHTSIFIANIVTGEFDQYIPNRNDVRQFKLHKIIIGQSMHLHPGHLLGNFVGLTPACYRMIDYLNKNQTKLYSFWFIYGSIGVFAGLLSEPFFYVIYKKFLLFYFKNDMKMIEIINKYYDKIQYSKESMERGFIGASGVIAGLETFNTLSSIELSIKGLWSLFKDYIWNNNEDDIDGLIDITDQIMGEYDILDYDMDENDPTPGHTQDSDNDDDDDIGIINKQEKYQINRLCYDFANLFYLLYHSNFAMKELWRHWKYGLQQRGGHNLLILQSPLYKGGMIGHTGGAIAGVAVYILFKLFCARDRLFSFVGDY